MLKRQKLLLSLIAHSGGSITRTTLMKLAFLTKFETSLKSDTTFYDFVPYKYGPFSFALYRELSSLAHNGYLSPDEDNAISMPSQASLLSQGKIEELSEHEIKETKEIAERYGALPQTKLLKEVYANYPWYSCKSERRDLKPPSAPRLRTARPAVYTIGYEGRSVDSFFREILRCGVKAILDVRANPVSRKYGFAKKSLGSIANRLDIEYHHIPELGIHGSLRKSLGRLESYQRLFLRYQEETLSKEETRVRRVADYMKLQPSVLLCMEKDASLCHRGCLAEAVAALNGLRVKNL